MNTEPPRFPEGTRTTRLLRPGDWATTPDGNRRGMVRCVYPGGPRAAEPGKTTIQFVSSSVQVLSGSDLPSPHSWVTCDDNANWQVELGPQ